MKVRNLKIPIAFDNQVENSTSRQRRRKQQTDSLQLRSDKTFNTHEPRPNDKVLWSVLSQEKHTLTDLTHTLACTQRHTDRKSVV